MTASQVDDATNDARGADGPGSPIRLQDTVRLSADGLAKVLGDLEALVVQTVWKLGRPAPARAIHERVAEHHPVAIHTVITVLNKLVEKGLLRRDRHDELLHFSARVSEEEFRAEAAKRVVRGILSFGPDAVTASFVDVLAEADRDQLARLAELVRRRLDEEAER